MVLEVINVLNAAGVGDIAIVVVDVGGGSIIEVVEEPARGRNCI